MKRVAQGHPDLKWQKWDLHQVLKCMSFLPCADRRGSRATWRNSKPGSPQTSNPMAVTASATPSAEPPQGAKSCALIHTHSSQQAAQLLALFEVEGGGGGEKVISPEPTSPSPEVQLPSQAQ